MAKKIQLDKFSNRGSGVDIERATAVDDSLLPSPDELVKYQQIEPSIVSWIMERTTEEQRMRHLAETEKIKIMNRAIDNERSVIINRRLSISFFCLIDLLLIITSALLVWYDKQIAGSIFGAGGAICSFHLYRKLIK